MLLHSSRSFGPTGLSWRINAGQSGITYGVSVGVANSSCAGIPRE